DVACDRPAVVGQKQPEGVDHNAVAVAQEPHGTPSARARNPPSPIGARLARAVSDTPGRAPKSDERVLLLCTARVVWQGPPRPAPEKFDEITMALTRTRDETPADLVEMAQDATAAIQALLADATLAVRARVSPSGHVSSRMLDREQRATHGLAWLATYAEAIRQLAAYAERMHEAGRLGELEALAARIGIGEYL